MPQRTRHEWGTPRTYGPGPIVGRYIVDKPLTASQLRRLPRDLRDRVA
jgi:hypothetical protein